MMTKWLVVLGALVLAGCSGVAQNEVPTADYPDSEVGYGDVDGVEYDLELEVLSDSEFEFSVDILTEEEFANLENYIALDYQALSGQSELLDGLILKFNFNQPVTNLVLSRVEHTGDEYFPFDFPVPLAGIGDLNPDTPLILTHYVGLGTFPSSGLIFTVPTGEEMHITFQQSMKDGSMIWNLIPWSVEAWEDFLVRNWVEPPNYHIAQQGETLFSIARLHNTTVEFLQLLNDLGDSTDIQAGQQVYLVNPVFFRNLCGISDLDEPNCDLATNDVPFTRLIGAGGIRLLNPPQAEPASISLERINELRAEMESFESAVTYEGAPQPWTFPFVATLMHYSMKWDVDFLDPTYGQRVTDFFFATYFLDRAEVAYYQRN